MKYGGGLMRALIIKEFRELSRDRRTLSMLIVVPIVLLVVFGYAANFTVSEVSTMVIGKQADFVAEALEHNPTASEHLNIKAVDKTLGTPDVEKLLREQQADTVIVADGQQPTVFIDGSALFSAQAAQQALLQINSDATILFNPELKTSWVMIPGLIGLVLLFIGVLITSIGLVRERETGTLEQLAVMPIQPAEIIFGKVAPYFLLAVVDMIVVTLIGVGLFGVPFTGSITLFSLAAVIFLLVVLGIGVFISSVSYSTGQAIQLAILLVVPQVLLSGLIFPLYAMPLGVRWIGYLLPLTWFREISQGIMLRGAGINSLWEPLLILLVMAVVVFGAAIVRMNSSLTPGGGAK